MKAHVLLAVLAAVLLSVDSASAGWTLNDLKDEYEKAKQKALNSRDEAIERAKQAIRDLKGDAARWGQNIRNLGPKGAAEEVWGEAGRVAYVAAASEMAKKPSKQPTAPLDDKFKLVLYREFGDLVHKVRIHWGVEPMGNFTVGDAVEVLGINPLLPQILNAKLENVIIQGTDAIAQTYGYDIYLKEDKAYYAERERALVRLLAHEMAHSQQFERCGSLSEFGYQYFKEFKKAGTSYENNTMEVEAETVAERVIATKGLDEALKVPADKLFAALLKEFEDRVKLTAVQQTGQYLLASGLLLAAVEGGDELFPFGGEKVVKASGYIQEFSNIQQGGGENRVYWRFHGDGRKYFIAVDHANPNGSFTAALLQHSAVTGKKVYVTSMFQTYKDTKGATPADLLIFQAVEVTVTFPVPKGK